MTRDTRYQRERRRLAAARRDAFAEASVRRNRVSQTDFTEFETTRGGTWRPSSTMRRNCAWRHRSPAPPAPGMRSAPSRPPSRRPIISLATPSSPTASILRRARSGPSPSSPTTGPPTRARTSCGSSPAGPGLRHVRTRRRAPETNGVSERFKQCLKDEHLHRVEAEVFRDLYITVRPHEALSFGTPISRYWRIPDHSHPGQTLSTTLDTGHLGNNQVSLLLH